MHDAPFRARWAEQLVFSRCVLADAARARRLRPDSKVHGIFKVTAKSCAVAQTGRHSRTGRRPARLRRRPAKRRVHSATGSFDRAARSADRHDWEQSRGTRGMSPKNVAAYGLPLPSVRLIDLPLSRRLIGGSRTVQRVRSCCEASPFHLPDRSAPFFPTRFDPCCPTLSRRTTSLGVVKDAPPPFSNRGVHRMSTSPSPP